MITQQAVVNQIGSKLFYFEMDAPIYTGGDFAMQSLLIWCEPNMHPGTS